jgi:hypothetical protein
MLKLLVVSVVDGNFRHYNAEMDANQITLEAEVRAD